MKSQEIENFFLTLTGCQLGVFTEKNFRRLSEEQPLLYNKMKDAFQSQHLQKRNSMDPGSIDRQEINARKSMKKTMSKID